MSAVEFLLFVVDVGNDEAHDFFNVFYCGEVGSCL